MATDKPTRRRSFLVGCIIAAAVLVTLLVVAAVGNLLFMKKKSMAYQAAGAPSESRMMAEDMGKMAAAPEAASAGAGGPDGGPSTPTASFPFSAAEAAVVSPARKIIYSADVTMEARDVPAVAKSIEQMAEAVGGWASAELIEGSAPGQFQGSITIRVPAERFAQVHDAIGKLGEVRRDSINTQDVTEEFVDAEARLRNSRRAETALAGLLGRQGRVTDILEVERELARVRGEIEQVQGRLRFLKTQVSYSTITVQLYTKHSEAVRQADKWDLGYHVVRAWRALLAVARALTYTVIYTVIVGGPFVLLVWIIWRIARAGRRRPSRPDLPPPAS